MKWKYCLWIFLPVIFAFSVPAEKDTLKILVFSKTAGFRHQCIPKGIAAFKKLAVKNGWEVDFTEDAAVFNASLLDYKVIVFLNTTGNILNDEQQEYLKKYMSEGRGFVGIHAAADTEQDWPWYNGLVGAVFESHPKIQPATLRTSENYSAFFGKDYTTRQSRDEWYNFKQQPGPDITVLTYLDEDSYSGGTHKNDHPITWFHKYGGGRAFYTGLGHTEEQYDDSVFLEELVTAVSWASGKNRL